MPFYPEVEAPGFQSIVPDAMSGLPFRNRGFP